MKEVCLYGAGGHARVIIDILRSRNISVKEIYDDNPEIKECMNIPVVNGSISSPLIVSVGNNKTRKKIVEKLSGISYAQAIDESSIVSESASIGIGSVIMQGAILQSLVKIGKHVIINTGATVDHDCVVEDFVHIAPGVNLCGNVQVGEGTLLGVGTVVIPGIKIGRWSVISAGSVVTKNIPDNAIVAGNPCRIIKIIE
ncbi:MAG: acetyltransferase [Dysgonomonas sp.]|nr:acetyltransferase [Dysgonomonas sp.]